MDLASCNQHHNASGQEVTLLSVVLTRFTCSLRLLGRVLFRPSCDFEFVRLRDRSSAPLVVTHRWLLGFALAAVVLALRFEEALGVEFCDEFVQVVIVAGVAFFVQQSNIFCVVLLAFDFFVRQRAQRSQRISQNLHHLREYVRITSALQSLAVRRRLMSDQDAALLTTNAGEAVEAPVRMIHTAKDVDVARPKSFNEGKNHFVLQALSAQTHTRKSATEKQVRWTDG